MTERSEIGIANAGFDTQSFQTNRGSHPFTETGDENIRHMYENVRDQQSAKTNQGTSASWLAEGSMESTALLNVDLYDGVYERIGVVVAHWRSSGSVEFAVFESTGDAELFMEGMLNLDRARGEWWVK